MSMVCAGMWSLRNNYSEARHATVLEQSQRVICGAVQARAPFPFLAEAVAVVSCVAHRHCHARPPFPFLAEAVAVVVLA